MADFEEQYQDVLQNIEFAIVQVFHQDSELVDFDVENALDALIAKYRAEQINREPRPHNLNARAQQVYSMVASMCEWRLGREALIEGNENSPINMPPAVSLDEIVACLKRIRKSVRTWNKRGGRQGYLLFVEQYVI